MTTKQGLVSWIGHADLAAMCQDLSDSERGKITGVVKVPDKAAEPPGPVKTAVGLGKWAEVHLLTNYPKVVNQAYTKWLGVAATVHEVELADPTNYQQVFSGTDKVLDRLRPRFGRGRLDLCILLSPGTPAMAATWVLLGKSRYPATFYQTFRGKLQATEIPYDLVDDFVPELLRDPDLNLQHLAAKNPSEVAGFESIVGESQPIRVAVGRAQRAALRDVPVLLLGDSGTGKEMFARAIHAASRRKNGPFLPINCAAIPKELLESELFGHVKGAFTGANQDFHGAFARANGGTLFLDEIGECDSLMQTKLLRVLQPPPGKGPCCREFYPVKGSKLVESDVRIVAATNRDLLQDIKNNRFREDLYYRLAVITLRLPPLRDRKRDIPLLAKALLDQINRDFAQQEPGYKHKSISTGAMEFVKNHGWPGNVRQLYNALLQAAVMAEGEEIERRDVIAAVGDMGNQSSLNALEHPLGDEFNLEEHLNSIQSHYLRRALDEAKGNKSKAARLLGMKHYQTLDAQLARLKVDWNGPPS